MIRARRETHVLVLHSSIELRLRKHFVYLIFYVNFRFIIHYSSFLYEYSSYFTTLTLPYRGAQLAMRHVYKYFLVIIRDVSDDGGALKTD